MALYALYVCDVLCWRMPMLPACELAQTPEILVIKSGGRRNRTGDPPIARDSRVNHTRVPGFLCDRRVPGSTPAAVGSLLKCQFDKHSFDRNMHGRCVMCHSIK